MPFTPSLYLHIRYIIPILTLIFATNALAEPHHLQQKIEALIHKEIHAPVSLSIQIITPPEDLQSICPEPHLRLTGNPSRQTGRRTLIAECDGKRKFIQINVRATGEWWVASRQIKAGDKLTRENIRKKFGDLSGVPSSVLQGSDEALGMVAIRAIQAGKPLIKANVRQPWHIIKGHTVDLVVNGRGFAIRTQGTALNNASSGESVRVKTASGQIVAGKASAEGKVVIFKR